MRQVSIYQYSFNDLIYKFTDTGEEITNPHILSATRRYRGEFQNMGPKIQHMWTPSKDPFWLYDLK